MAAPLSLPEGIIPMGAVAIGVDPNFADACRVQTTCIALPLRGAGLRYLAEKRERARVMPVLHDLHMWFAAARTARPSTARRLFDATNHVR